MINLSSKISGIPTSAFAEIKIINVKNVATGANLPVDVNNNSFRLDYRNSGN